MVADYRILRGDAWASSLRELLLPVPIDMAIWMEQHTRLLKSDSHSRVGLLQLQGQLCYLKFYRRKSPWQQLLFRLGRGRGIQSYDVASELLARGVAVPEARACLLVGEGMLLLTEGMENSQDLKALWQAGLADCRQDELLRAAGVTLAQVHRAGFSHGDCKWSNLLWSGQQFYLVDLEAAQRASTLGVGQARDLARFSVNAEDLGVAPARYEQFMQSYLEGTGHSREEVVECLMPPLGELRLRHLSKYGERGARLL